METSTKNEIRECLMEYISRYKSQNIAANTLTGISGSYVSQIVNGKFSAISDDMWRKLALQIGWVNKGWIFTDTRISSQITQSINLAKSRAINNITPILARGGSGKTITAQNYAKSNREVLYINCKRKLSLKSFLKGLLSAAGKTTEGLTSEVISDMLISTISKMNNPVIIIDEANKASDNILLEIIDLYNGLKYKCPIILLATQEFKLRIERGVNKKMGYDELHSRFNRQFIDLGEPDYNDVAKVCIANGLSDATQISDIAKSSLCDLRAVEDKVKVQFLKQAKAA
jgi:hypothetical protein